MKYSGTNTLTEMIVKTKEYVNQKVSGLYNPAGSIAFSAIPTLSANVLGNVYNITDATFTTDARFVEGAGKTYTAGTNIVVVNTGTTSSPVYMLDVLSGLIDFDVYVVATADANGYPDIATPDTNVIYLVPTIGGCNSFYYNGTNFVGINLNVDNIQKETLPAATANLVDKIYQYTGATSANYTQGYFYKCTEDTSTVPSTYKWEQINVQPGGSGGSATKKTINVSIDLGGYSKNDVIATGTDYDTVIETLLNPTILPTYTSPSASLSYSLDNSGYYKVGATVAAKTATLTYNAGAIMLDGVKQNDRGGAATNYAVSTSGATTEYSSSSTTSGTFSVSALTRATKGTIVITGTVLYAQGAQPKDSKGADVDAPLPAGSVSATKTLNFIQPFYYGASNTSTISDFTGLTESVTPKANKTFSFTTSNQHMVMAYDSSYGNLKSILDPNSFETISGWTKSTVTVDGFSYYVYVANAKTTDTSAAFQFKF